MIEAQIVNQKSRDAARSIMNSLPDNDMSYGEALNAMMIAFIYSAIDAGINKENLIDNISDNWDISIESLENDVSNTH